MTLEPCFHTTGEPVPVPSPLIRAGVGGVVHRDPRSESAGCRERHGAFKKRGESRWTTAWGEGVARFFDRAFRLPDEDGLPWIQAKWAMTIDGKIAQEAVNPNGSPRSQAGLGPRHEGGSSMRLLWGAGRFWPMTHF